MAPSTLMAESPSGLSAVCFGGDGGSAVTAEATDPRRLGRDIVLDSIDLRARVRETQERAYQAIARAREVIARASEMVERIRRRRLLPPPASFRRGRAAGAGWPSTPRPPASSRPRRRAA